MARFTLEPYRPHLVCGARRGPGSRITCVKPALHRQDCRLAPGRACAGQGRRGQWYFWFSPVP